MTKRKYNCKLNTPNTKLKIFLPRFLSPKLPTVVTQLANLGPVLDQGNQGSCTAHGWRGCWDFLYLKDLNIKAQNASIEFDISTFTPGSRDFLYGQELLADGNAGQDVGSTVATGGSVLSTIGLCPESMFPYGDGNFALTPPKECFDIASQHKLQDPQRVIGIDGIRNALYQGCVVVVGVSVFDSFEQAFGPGRNGDVPDPNPLVEHNLGGHCILIFGYNDSTQRFNFRNSWSAEVGDNGNGTFSYKYVDTYGSDFHTASK
jgi:hypothetical protein